MPKADKLPTVDTMQPDVYMAILRAVDIERKRRNSHEYRKQMEREEQANGEREKAREAMARRALQASDDEIWAARIRALPSYPAEIPKL